MGVITVSNSFGCRLTLFPIGPHPAWSLPGRGIQWDGCCNCSDRAERGAEPILFY